MDRFNKNRSKRNSKAKKAPKVPIKTYRWEDVRRARRRGGYPWTHLYKGPFTEKVDQEQFTMEAFRREKSTSPMGKRSDKIEISEVSSWADYSGKTTPTLLQELINEPGENVSGKNSRPGSVVIEEYVEEDDKDLEDDVQVKEFQTESAGSSGNISQYLDQEDREPVKPTTSEVSDINVKEEPTPRKRKLSGESKYSFSKLDVMKRLQKIKIPKISFPTKKVARKRVSPPKEEKSRKAVKTVPSQPRKEHKPEYIHIPLKPPPGETDQFSYLESETEQNNGDKSITSSGSGINVDKRPSSKLERVPRVTQRPPLKINPAFKQFLTDVRQLKDKELVETGKDPTVDETPMEIEELEASDNESPKEDVFDKLFEARDAPTKIQQKSSTSRDVRSKSAEPQSKRRSSLESSHSRKSLSRLGIMKKIKSASEKIKSALSMDSLRRVISKKDETDKKKEQEEKERPKKPKPTSVVKAGDFSKPKNTEPVYIRIPLKPPEGQTDEFSYLANESANVTLPEAKKDDRTDSLDSTSPKNEEIQFIFLTPPSDDELLDKEPDIPETPSSSSDDIVFFGSLKKLAQAAVDQVSPETGKKQLETVSEESDKNPNVEIEVPVEEDSSKESTITDEQQPIKVEEISIVDVEDGLSETPKTEEHLKSALKTAETTSPKRVSFKRKSKTPKDKGKDSEYEPIETPDKQQEITSFLQDELEKVEGKKIESGDICLEEDCNESSNVTGDHEYELINPPEDPTVVTSDVTVVTGVDTDPKVVISATEIFDKPYEEKKKPFFQFGGMFHKDKDREKSQERGGSSDTQSKSSQDIQEQTKTSSAEPNKLQLAFRQRAEQLKMKTSELKNKIKSIHLPKTPEFKKSDFKQRFKIEKPKINLHLPKIPDKATIRLPNISLPGSRKTTVTRTVETRRFSTESNAGDSTKRRKFDLSFGGTFPRFRKSKKPDQEVIFATVPRAKRDKAMKSGTASSEDSGGVRIPLHSDDSMDTAERLESEEEIEDKRTGHEDRETSDEISRSTGRRLTGEDDYERENQAINQADYLSRWQRGNFKDRNDDVDNEERIVGQLVEQRFGRGGLEFEGYDIDRNRTETLEERLRRDEERPRYIEDEEDEEEGEFDLRLMQDRYMVTDLDNLEEDHAERTKDGYSSEGSGSLQRKGRLGKLDIDSDEFFVVHEIREGFQTPANALAQMNEYDPIGSNRSLPTQMLESQKPQPIVSDRKQIKKPKRKKTPHVSQEEILGDEESFEKAPVPSRPKRRSKKNKKSEKNETLAPYQETIPLETTLLPHGHRLDFPRESLGILGDDEDEYENELNGEKVKEQEPSVPPRKLRSLKSLTQSDLDIGNIEDQIIPTRPDRRTRSQASSLSRTSLPPSPRDADSVLTDVDDQQIPSYLIENQSYKKQWPGQGCGEEPCVQDVRDYMGYSIVDKSKPREPPLPPPRTPPRRKKRAIEPEEKFATVPRNMGLSGTPPVRPLRNYSTLSHVKSSRKGGTLYENDKENKENETETGQYIEIEDEVSKDLVSGEVVQKMRQRPLPAPPRPPRKTKTTRKSLQDITSKENIIFISSNESKTEEETVSTQTEPLPPDFVCEEIQQEPTDTIITPRTSETPQRCEIYDPRTQSPDPETKIRRELITPSVYSFEETVTHGTLLVQPIDGAKLIPDHQLSKERLIPVTREADNDETSEVPENFRRLGNPEEIGDESEQLRKVEKLQVTDLDVDRLTVNQLLASKIVVSEIDTSSLSANEIQGQHGSIKLGNIELPPQLLEQLLLKQLESREERLQENLEEQKKTSTADKSPPLEISAPSTNRLQQLQFKAAALVETPPNLPDDNPQENEPPELSSENTSGLQRHDLSPDPPVPPPRGCTLEEAKSDAHPRLVRTKSDQDSPDGLITDNPATFEEAMLEPDVDEQPPPRPPQPLEGLYFPSQPPPSFYALRAKQFVDEHIPSAPRRRRQHGIRSRPVSRSRSTSDDDSTTGPIRSSRLARRVSEPTIPELSGRLVRACGSRANVELKRLIYHLTENLVRNADGKQDLHVFMVILLVLIAGLILLGYGEDRTVVHLHHWEYFNPPKDL